MKVLKYPLLHHEKFRYPLLQSVKMTLGCYAPLQPLWFTCYFPGMLKS